jgi:hypothetical protein
VRVVDAHAASSAGGPPVQLRPAARAGGESHEVVRHAQAGVRGGGSPLPHVATIQEAFGRHDVAHVRAHVGGGAAAACRAMGAEAYAMGSDVAFGRTPSLRTAAHEAAHVVQQRAGVHLSGGVGQADDPYERQADAVADAVVRGASAESLLDAHAGSAAPARAQVQRKLLRADLDGNTPTDTTSVATALARLGPPGAALGRFLPTLAASEADYVFPPGETDLDPREAADIVSGSAESTVLEGDSWSFVMRVIGGKGNMEDALATRGTELSLYGDRWIVTLDLSELPHITPAAIEAVHALPVDERLPERLMTVQHGLTYRCLARDQGQFKELGLTGRTLLSVTQEKQEKHAGANAAAKAMRTWLTEVKGYTEIFQSDPRHVGSHNPYDMLSRPHFHVIAPKGGAIDQGALLSYMLRNNMFGMHKDEAKRQERLEAQEARRQGEEAVKAEIAAFLGAGNLSANDEPYKNRLAGMIPTRQPEYWKKIKGSLEWRG